MIILRHTQRRYCVSAVHYLQNNHFNTLFPTPCLSLVRWIDRRVVRGISGRAPLNMPFCNQEHHGGVIYPP